ncbi:hypothetical protein [Pseudorhizobium banfieldiae]|uniref:hypothetical protein n=1 Tax=Pseudorhizobium banfieldiae TaxID=1125847 RepID=UPI001266879A|nr:hypothetical protein [Pseudorhizobium banfieldiae]
MTRDIESRPGEVTLLALIAAVVEAWKWFVTIPLAAALSVYLILLQLGVDHQSTAILKSDEAAALLNSPLVLGPTIEELNMRDELGSSMNDAIEVLSRRLSIKEVAPDIIQVSIMDRDAERTQLLLTTVIRNYARQIAPRGQEREQIEGKIAARSAALEQLWEYAQVLQSERRSSEVVTGGSGDAALGYVELVREILEKQDDITELQRTLEGLPKDDILQEPTLAEAEVKNRFTFSALAAIAAGLLITFIVLVRETVRRAPEDLLALHDLKRIKAALPFSRRP